MTCSLLPARCRSMQPRRSRSHSPAPPAVGTTYTWLLTSGSETGSGSFLAQQHGYTISNTTPGVVTITYVGGPAVANQVWNSTSSSSWDVNTSANWFNTDSSTTDNFFNGDNVTFNDSISGVQTAVTLTTSLAPGSLTVNSNTSNYTFTSASSTVGKITGTTGLTKLGTSTLTIATALNDYTGVTNISGGILNVSSLAAINTASSIGKGSAAGSAGDLVLNGGTLQYTGSTSQTTNRLFTIGTNGATIDSSGSSGAVLNFNSSGSIAFAGSGPHILTLKGSAGYQQFGDYRQYDCSRYRRRYGKRNQRISPEHRLVGAYGHQHLHRRSQCLQRLFGLRC